MPSDAAAHFALLSMLTSEELTAAVQSALRVETGDPIELEERIEVVRQAERRLREGDAVGAVRALRNLVSQLPASAAAVNRGPAGRSPDLVRRFINQILLLELVDGESTSAGSSRPMLTTWRSGTHWAYTCMVRPTSSRSPRNES